MDETGHPTPRAATAGQIFLVEDEESFRELLAAYLRGLGHVVEVAADGAMAVRCVQERAYDVIITDLCMPRCDGMELLMHLRKLKCVTPVIAMSGGVDGEMAGMLKAARFLGARCTLTKPFALSKLAAAVNQVLSPPVGAAGFTA